MEMQKIKRWATIKFPKLIGWYAQLKYPVMRLKYRKSIPRILSLRQTLQLINEGRLSVSRYGDGEFSLMQGGGSIFSAPNHKLTERLREVAACPIEGHLTCLAYSIGTMKNLRWRAIIFWRKDLAFLFKRMGELFPQPVYGNAQISRFYIDFKWGRDEVLAIIGLWHKIWDGRDLLIVEGENSRLGIGNDLFDNAGEITRILCPAKNSFDSYDEILAAVKRHYTGQLILIALGQTATVLAYDLAKEGIQALDVGHIDVEYEWFRMGARQKVDLKYKAVSELQGDNKGMEVAEVESDDYHRQIVARIGQVHETEVSVIIPVYNGEKFLEKAVASVLNQSMKDFELIIVDDGSTDSTPEICRRLRATDSRIRVIRQPNGGPNAARRSGVANSSGKWVVFVDADDTINQDALKHMLAVASDEIDIISCDSGVDSDVSGREFRWQLLLKKEHIGPLWNKLIRRELIADGLFVMPGELVISEDLILNLRLAARTSKPIRLLPINDYNYTPSKTSLTKSYHHNPQYEEFFYNELIKELTAEEMQMYLTGLIVGRIKQWRMMTRCRLSVDKEMSTDFYNHLMADIAATGYKLTLTNRFHLVWTRRWQRLPALLHNAVDYLLFCVIKL